jgi:hypothetical protein
MITPPTLLEHVKAKPFRPFRIQMASGKTYDVRHPELVKVGKTYVMIFTPADGDLDVVDTFETVSLMLSESISHLESPVA